MDSSRLNLTGKNVQIMLAGLMADKRLGIVSKYTSEDKNLVLSSDDILEFRFDSANLTAVADTFDYANGNGIKDSATPVKTVEVDQVTALWEAGNLCAPLLIPSAGFVMKTIGSNVSMFISNSSEVVFAWWYESGSKIRWRCIKSH